MCIYTADCIVRIDLACVGHSGEEPVFAASPLDWGSLFPSDVLPVYMDSSLLPMTDNAEEKLAIIFHDLRCFTSAINANVRRHKRWESNSFQIIINSIQSRLLQLSSTPKQPLRECLRLGMLAFLTTTFVVPGRRIPYTFLAERLQSAIQALAEGEELSGHSTIRLWALMMGAISFLDIESDWICAAWRAWLPTVAMSWKQFRMQLMSVMWIECMHDELGRTVFQRLSLSSQSSGKDIPDDIVGCDSMSITPH